jgi:hypothetical protein
MRPSCGLAAGMRSIEEMGTGSSACFQVCWEEWGMRVDEEIAGENSPRVGFTVGIYAAAHMAGEARRAVRLCSPDPFGKRYPGRRRKNFSRGNSPDSSIGSLCGTKAEQDDMRRKRLHGGESERRPEINRAGISLRAEVQPLIRRTQLS